MRNRRKPPVVVGLDLSLRRPAAVCIPKKWEVGDWKALPYWVGEPPEPKDFADIEGHCKRLEWIVRRVRAFVERHEATHVFAEDYAFSQRGPAARKLAELGGSVRFDLFTRWGMVMRTVVASSARKLLLGKLPREGQKAAVEAALTRAGAPLQWGNDECDAFVVANYALSELGLVAMSLA